MPFSHMVVLTGPGAIDDDAVRDSVDDDAVGDSIVASVAGDFAGD